MSLPYWLVNVPRKDWPSECPPYLIDLSDKDKVILATRDEDYRDLTWNEVKEVVARDDLAAFQRRPSDLRLYRWYVASLQRKYGSVMAFILKGRLRWESLVPKSVVPFDNADDYKILLNDAPYGIDKRIVHIVVWTKTAFEEDPATGDLSRGGWKQIDDFVRERFTKKMPSEEQVTWFKNPMVLRSVKAIDHFHVMLFDPAEKTVEDVTSGDVVRPMELGQDGDDAYR